MVSFGCLVGSFCLPAKLKTVRTTVFRCANAHFAYPVFSLCLFLAALSKARFPKLDLQMSLIQFWSSGRQFRCAGHAANGTYNCVSLRRCSLHLFNLLAMSFLARLSKAGFFPNLICRISLIQFWWSRRQFLVCQPNSKRYVRLCFIAPMLASPI